MFSASRSIRWLAITTGMLLLYVAYRHFVRNTKIFPPGFVVSDCTQVKPGIRRITTRPGLEFDVPLNNFAIYEGAPDAPPPLAAFELRLKDSSSSMSVEEGGTRFPEKPMPVDLEPTRVERREIREDVGHRIGEDSWGYLDRGQRWRRVLFRGGIVASYAPVNEQDAELFDQVIDSACRGSGPSLN